MKCDTCGSELALRDAPKKRDGDQPLRSGNEIDWSAAEKASKAIVKQIEDAGFDPPEAMDKHQYRILRICEAMNTLVDALRLRQG